MANINQSFFDRIRFTLYNPDYGNIVINEPIGWNTDEKEFARNEEYFGIIAKFSNNLKFIKDAKDFIKLVYDIYGIQGILKLTKEEKNPKTDIWELSYIGFLDLSTYKYQKNIVSVKFNSGGLEEILKARETDEYELDRLTTVDGKTLQPLANELLELEGRNIFLQTSYENKESDKIFTVDLFNNGDLDDTFYHINQSLPLTVVNKSHEEASNSTIGSYRLNRNRFLQSGIGTASSMFFYNSNVGRNFNIKINTTLKIVSTKDQGIDYSLLDFMLVKYSNNNRISQSWLIRSADRDEHVANFSGVYETLLWNGNFLYPNPNPLNFNDYNSVTDNFNQNIFVGQGESLALEIILQAEFDAFEIRRARVQVLVEKAKVVIEENSFREKTICKMLLPYEVGDRLVQIISGKQNSFKSDFFGRQEIGYPNNGKGMYYGLKHGFWVRGFDKLPLPTEENANLFKPFTTSFKQFYSSYDAICNLGLGIEKIGYSEKIVIEEKKYFFNRNVTIKLPNQVKNVSREPALNWCFSKIEIGYEKGGKYEEAFGLDEPNAKSSFTTNITKVKNPLSKISSYRADSYGKEFCRRKPFLRYATEDTTYDNDIFIDNLKKEAGIFREKKWQDDLDILPTGIFKPENATNLIFSPFNMLLNHGSEIQSGLLKYPNEFVRYASSESNSNLITKLIGKPEYSENGNIKNSELKRARFKAEKISFEHICDFEILKAINGHTIILGEKIMNVYGLIEFINENNEKERGWLLSCKPNGKGQWELLTANI